MARLFEIFPLTTISRDFYGTVTRDDTIMYAMDAGSETAFDLIFEPYGRFAVPFLNDMRLSLPGPWAFVALRQEYDIAEYIKAKRSNLSVRDGNDFKFTYYDNRSDTGEDDFVPKVGCLVSFQGAPSRPLQGRFASLSLHGRFFGQCRLIDVGLSCLMRTLSVFLLRRAANGC